jgi:Zn-dependent peptidase ImmA (M78 family)
MTLAHEYGHVWLHSELWRETTESAVAHRCQREQIEAGSLVDWMEWQAGYGAAALLMPESRLRLVVRACWGEDRPTTRSQQATSLIQRVSEAFDVSEEAARVRLSQLGYLRGVPA